MGTVLLVIFCLFFVFVLLPALVNAFLDWINHGVNVLNNERYKKILAEEEARVEQEKTSKREEDRPSREAKEKAEQVRISKMTPEQIKSEDEKFVKNSYKEMEKDMERIKGYWNKD